MKFHASVALVVVYNERFEENIPIVEKIYKDRFSHIYHLMPYYQGAQENVIKVVGTKDFFQSYISQGYKFYCKSEFTHYMFIADDLLLNPQINEKNYCKYFNINRNQSFITSLVELEQEESIRRQARWLRYWALLPYACNSNILRKYVGKQLPSYDEAINRFREFGFSVKLFNRKAKHQVPLKYALDQIELPLKKHRIIHFVWKISLNNRAIRYLLKKMIPQVFNQYIINSDSQATTSLEYFIKKLNIVRMRKNYIDNNPPISYPTISGYADMAIVSADSIQRFCSYCHFFAKSKLYVELAIPTALILADKDIQTEKGLTYKMFREWPWDSDNIQRKAADKRIQANYYNQLKESILQMFPADFLYIHPIKLSKWKLDKICFHNSEQRI